MADKPDDQVRVRATTQYSGAWYPDVVVDLPPKARAILADGESMRVVGADRGIYVLTYEDGKISTKPWEQ